MRSAHLRLAELYRILNDEQNDALQERLAACLAEEMELICGVCQERYGDQGGNSLEALPCSHIFHSKWVCVCVCCFLYVILMFNVILHSLMLL